MSMTLSGAKRTLCVGHGPWSQTLAIAHENGWQPMGTLPPICDQHMASGNYSSNDSQLIVDEDAANMADALERALPGIPDSSGKRFLQEMIVFFRQGGIRLY